ncbi:hypothetical protein GCM10027187_42050 [Streptosporangium sandarakinum]|uniref:Pimeloyl-ACP methyl ester carboxylesterase n=1 Tax=Streptosporangium sandarakinum TaxID=1260955 RepID=A0A852V0Q8_9ACTN|nr:alpha/beta fold hydrolase [Streptosporangium sandarakinum]NYF43352.1 pimeloyl-ACP methyl ester carboxylesterase [Streptosporangium sandarakinum]
MRRRASSGWDGREVTAVAGIPMYAAVLGPASAPEVVCVHGLGCSHRHFLPLARHLAPASRVVAVDLPGFGRTPGPREPLDIRGLSLTLAGWLRATARGGGPGPALLGARRGDPRGRRVTGHRSRGPAESGPGPGPAGRDPGRHAGPPAGRGG